MMMVNDFKREVLEWADQVRVIPKEIHVRHMKRKWASCSSNGRLSFSYALLSQPREKRAKAIIHELLHLRYPPHSKMFNSMLIAYLSKNGIDSASVIL